MSERECLTFKADYAKEFERALGVCGVFWWPVALQQLAVVQDCATRAGWCTCNAQSVRCRSMCVAVVSNVVCILWCRHGRYTYGEAVVQAVALAASSTLDCELPSGDATDAAMRPRQGQEQQDGSQSGEHLLQLRGPESCCV